MFRLNSTLQGNLFSGYVHVFLRKNSDMQLVKKFSTMGCEKNRQSASFSNLTIIKKSVGNIFAEKPVFCDNGNSLIICFNYSLHIYNTTTGDHVKQLFSCSDEVISYQLHPLDASQLIAVTENGELTVFNLKTGEIEYSIKLTINPKFLNKQKIPKFELKNEMEKNFDWETQPLDSLAHRKFLHAEVRAFQNNESEIFIWASWCLKDESLAHVSAFTFNKGKHIRLIHIKNSGLKLCNLNFTLGTVQGFEILAGMSEEYVHLTRYDTQKRAYNVKHYIGMEITITCLAFHPTECSIATGDTLGRIIVWKNIFEKHPLKQILHWHACPVHDLYFSKFGNYLFSGGEENVLVKWSLNSESKDFLPRLSSTIHHISGACEQSLLSVTTLDDKILILDFNFHKISTVQHFSRWSLLKRTKKQDVFAVDPRSDCLVLNGRTGHIQFLSLKEDGKFLYTFDITNRNFISDADFAIENTEVTHAKFSRDGKWMITAECRGESVCKESRLKFWTYCDKQNSFTLSTNVEFPHDSYEIFSLEISVDEMVATTGGDKKFRLWTVFESDHPFKEKEFWAVHAVNKYRDFPCRGIDFSKDASLVAITFGPVLTTWETESCTLKCTLSIPDKKDELKFCRFGNFELSHLVVTGSNFDICSWNLITLSILWMVPFESCTLISDPFSVYMAAFSVHNSLIIFNPSSPTPDLVLDKVTNSRVSAGHFIPTETGKLCLYFLTVDQELFCLDDAEKVSESVRSDTMHTFSTPYSLQLAEKQNRADFDKRKTIFLNKSNKNSVTGLLDSPAHALPNPSLLCLDVLKGLLVFSENQSTNASSVKEKYNDVGKTTKIPEISANVDADKIENKLVDIVKAIFK